MHVGEIQSTSAVTRLQQGPAYTQQSLASSKFPHCPPPLLAAAVLQPELTHMHAEPHT